MDEEQPKQRHRDLLLRRRERHPPAAAVGEKPPSERIVGWVSQPVVSLSLAGASLYVLVRLGQQIFYGQFGLAPEDVGLGYAETLARAAGFGSYIAVTIACAAGVRAYLRARGGTGTGTLVNKRFIPAVGVGVVVLVIWVSYFSWQQADAVKHGWSVSSFFVGDIGLRGEPVEIAWLGNAPDALAELADHKLMLLDQSGVTVTLYDVTDQRTVQVPSSILALSITPE